MTALFQQKSITHYISPEITVGFCQYGPTLTLGGVLSSAKNVVMINSIGLSVSVPFHSLKKEFEWFAFQSGSSSEANLGINIQAPSKFIVSPKNAHQYNILFTDNQRYAEMKNILLSISSSWETAKNTSLNKSPLQTFENFKKQTISRGMNEMVENMCYWKTGTYSLTIAVASQNEVFATERKFQMKEEQIELLKSNSASILANLCGQPAAIFHTVNVALEA